MADLDPRTNTKDRIEPHGELRPAKVGSRDDQVTMIAGGLDPVAEKGLRAVLWRNRDLFAWMAADMPRIHPSVITHRLVLFKEAKLVAQKRRRLGSEKAPTVVEVVKKLKEAEFIRELTYTTWLANGVMVRKPSGKWQMCTDYTDLNKACPKDSHPLPNIDNLVDGASGHKMLSFLDAYSGYNQIPMHPANQEKTAFITHLGSYCYEVMSFGLKNAGATYQRLMDKIFAGQIGRCLDAYVDDMVVRSSTPETTSKTSRKYSDRYDDKICD